MAYFILDRKIFVVSIINLFLAYKIYEYLKNSEKKIVRIPVVMNVNNNYLYQSMITLTSLAENSKKENYYDIFILIPNNFNIEYRLQILQLELKYRNINIKIIEGEKPYVKFENYDSNFSKLFLHLLIPGYDKMIYINYNTLIFADLEELFNIDLQENYFSGFLSNETNKHNFTYDNSIISLNKSINTNIMLINTKKLNQNNKINEFKLLYSQNKDNKNFDEKAMINILFKNETDILPEKYGMPNFDNVDIGLKYNLQIKEFYRYEENKFIAAFYEPSINDLFCKPWEKGYKCKQSIGWWYFAKKTKFFQEIKNKFGKLFEEKN